MATSIKDLMGSAYAAGFDVQTRTSIDGRVTVPVYDDLTTQTYWESKSGGYWLYNGLITAVKTGDHKGEIYVLTGVTETDAATIWPAPKKPSDTGYDSYTGPKWVGVGSVDSYVRKGEYVLAIYGYKSNDTEAKYYENPAGQVWDTKEHAEAGGETGLITTYSKYIKLTVASSEDLTSPTKIVYVDISSFVSKVNVEGEGCIVVSDPDPTTKIQKIGLYWEENEDEEESEE